MADDTNNASASTPVGTADVANASAAVEGVSTIRQMLSDSSTAAVAVLNSIATAFTQKILGGVVGTTTNRLLKSKTVSSGSSAGSLQASGVTCDGSNNLSGIANLDMSGTLSAATLNPTNPLAINKGGTANITAAAAFDALAPTSAQGDIIYRNATTNTRLGAGTSGQFLKTQGTGADPVWASVTGGLTSIASGNLAAAATGATITGIANTYSYLILHIVGASIDTATRTTIVQASTDNGATYDSTAGNYIGWAFSGGSVTNLTLASLTASKSFFPAAATADITINIFGYQGQSYVMCDGVQKLSTGGTDTAVSQVRYIGATANINALKILVGNGSGAFDAGAYALWGVF